MAVLYRHIKPNGETFYIGIGKTEKRAYSKKNRNKYWKHIIEKYNYEIQILKSDLTWEDACELEKMLISYYGRKDLNTGNLVNMTDGGDGMIGIVITEETRIKLRNKIFTTEYRKKLSITSTGRWHTSETKQKLSKINKGKKHSSETCKKLSEVSVKTKWVLNQESGIFYRSVKEAAIALELNYNTLKGRLNGSKINNTPLIYV